MHCILIKYKGKKLELSHPESFNELSASQFLAVVRYFLLFEQSLDSRPEHQLLLMKELLSIKLSKSFKNKGYRIIDTIIKEGLAEELIKLQEFLYQEQIFNNWILRELRLKEKVYQGPRSGFSYMTFGQFIYTDMMFMAYFQNQSDTILDKFIASLYLENPKEEFSTEKLDKKANILSKLSVVQKQAILFNYSSVRTWLTQRYPFVFGDKEESTSQEITLGKSLQSGWLSIRRQLAGDVLNLEKVDKVPMHDVLSDLNQRISNEK